MTLASILRHGAAICALAVAAALPAAARDFRIAVGDGAGGTQEALGRAFIAAPRARTAGRSLGGRAFARCGPRILWRGLFPVRHLRCDPQG